MPRSKTPLASNRVREPLVSRVPKQRANFRSKLWILLQPTKKVGNKRTQHHEHDCSDMPPGQVRPPNEYRRHGHDDNQRQQADLQSWPRMGRALHGRLTYNRRVHVSTRWSGLESDPQISLARVFRPLCDVAASSRRDLKGMPTTTV